VVGGGLLGEPLLDPQADTSSADTTAATTRFTAVTTS